MRRHAPLPQIEPLEARISPAAVFVLGANTSINNPLTYASKLVKTSSGALMTSTPLDPVTGTALLEFYNAGSTSGADFITAGNKTQLKTQPNLLTQAQYTIIADAVGQNPDVYFIKLGPGDEVEIPNGTGYTPLVNVSAGDVIAFFTDGVPSTQSDYLNVLATQLSGVSVGTKTAVSIGTDVHGDIVSNYNPFTGAIGGSSETLGSTTLLAPYSPTKDNPAANAITSITVTGSVLGNIVSNVNISRIFVTENVTGIFTGTAANNYLYQFVDFTQLPNGFTPPLSYNHTLNVTAQSGVAGPSLANMTIGSVGSIALGAGGAGAAGGGINGLTLLDDIVPITILGGAGGNGAIGSKTSGGAGGSINGVVFQPPPSTINSVTGLAVSTDTNYNAQITVTAGMGGNGLGTAKGGAGGNISGFYTDYNTASASNPGLANLVSNVQLQGGAGGSGGVAGAGGSLTNVYLLTSTPHESTLAGQIEFQLTGGNGGAASAGGKAGAGGSVTNSQVIDDALPSVNYSLVAPLPDDSVATSPTNNVTLIQGGIGGIASVKGSGGAGGTVSGITFEGYNLAMIGGAGGDGATTGGAGGTVSGINVLGSSGDLPGDNFHALEIYAAGGVGGSGGTGKGGTGGGVNGVSAQNADFDSTGATIASALATVPADLGLTNAISGIVFAGGKGGNAGKGAAGAGGSILNAKLTEIDFQTALHPVGETGAIVAIAGDGGDSTSAGGTGGAGGSVNNITNAGLRLANATITGGNGGNGGGGANTGKGGAGGTVTGLSLSSSEDIYPTRQTYVSSSPGYLLDNSQNFITDGVEPGDVVENTLTGQTTTVAATAVGGGPSVTTTELSLVSNIFASGDPYLLVNESVTGNAGEAFDYLIDNTVNFNTNGVQTGDVVENITSLGLPISANTPVAAEVAQVLNAHELLLEALAPSISADITRVGNQYAFTTLGGISDPQTAATPGAAYDNVILDPNSNFITEGVKAGDTVEDVTATQANGGTPVTATVLSVAAHSLTISTPASGQGIATPGDLFDFPTLSGDVYTYTGGNGGIGAVKGYGGAGGNVVTSNANTPANIIMAGGVGGAGGSLGAAGVGGSINNGTAISTLGSGSLIAGNAGPSSGKAAVGGSVNGGDIEALLNVTMTSGNGSNGGAGGNIAHGGYSGVLTNGGNFNPPAGNITIQAGAGASSSTGNGGAGGSITAITGFVSSGDGNGSDQFITQFEAGAGGNGVKAGGAGGNVSGIRFYGGGGQGVDFFIDAGDAGNASAAKMGATGGSVTDIGGGALGSGSQNSNFSLSTFTDFNHISAGNGGNAVSVGGTGGSVANVFVNATIGIRTDTVFGFDVANATEFADGTAPTATGAGGISVGSGGSGAVKGTPGNVENISADAIASIVAGHMHVGQAIESANLANIVTNVKLTALTPPSTVQNIVYTVTDSTYGLTQSTQSLPTNASALEVGSAINAAIATLNAQLIANSEPTISNVTVSVGTNGYVVTFVNNGAESPGITITAAEPASESDGTTVETVQGNSFTDTQEVQNVGVATVTTLPFTLSFADEFSGISYTTVQLPAKASATQVANALNALPSVIDAGGVTVAASNTGYIVTFDTPPVVPLTLITSNITPYTQETQAGTGTTPEIQNVQMFDANAFTLTFEGQTTGLLQAGASDIAVANALNMLSTVQNAGGVMVANGTSTSAGVTGYQVTFGTDGQQPLIVPNFSAAVAITPGTGSGNTGTPEVDTITIPTRGDIDPVEFASANFVGSIYNILQPNATTYTPGGSTFTFGDVPVDGLIAALSPLVKVGSVTTQPFENKNFVPEAYLTETTGGAALMVDNVNS